MKATAQDQKRTDKPSATQRRPAAWHPEFQFHEAFREFHAKAIWRSKINMVRASWHYTWNRVAKRLFMFARSRSHLLLSAIWSRRTYLLIILSRGNGQRRKFRRLPISARHSICFISLCFSSRSWYWDIRLLHSEVGGHIFWASFRSVWVSTSCTCWWHASAIWR